MLLYIQGSRGVLQTSSVSKPDKTINISGVNYFTKPMAIPQLSSLNGGNQPCEIDE